ncbi:uncharacterized protein P884DRAFT_283046 [Thermothelomyces heterothallicus CBS 202.75]|uniref:uncharacterized protein n=1 Tax=Thermothelomyces heterothallicus CBS 202.75 TaxID=1149848 RepID=UPI003742A9F9
MFAAYRMAPYLGIYAAAVRFHRSSAVDQSPIGKREADALTFGVVHLASVSLPEMGSGLSDEESTRTRRRKHQEESEVSKPPQTPGQGPSLDVLTEIRKIIKEELGQISSPSSPGASTGRDSTQQSIRQAVPNTSAARPQLTTPPAPAQHNSAPRLGPDVAACARPHPGVQCTNPSPTQAPHPVGPTQESPKELSAIDRKWGILFDQNGVPTKRWEQVIRGICNYLVAEYMPQNSLVVTPEKMAAFYSHHKLDVEVFPFAEIFRNRRDVPPVRLAELYQQLACEYYLVPAEPKARPTVPGLTLAGWTRWMTIVTRAYPAEEAQRLDKVVAALPINADSLLDGKPERLPKQISRHLLPERPNRESRVAVKDALRAHFEAIQQFPSRKTPSSANPPNPNSYSGRRASVSGPVSPRTRYRPSDIPSPPCSQTDDDSDEHHHYHHRRRTADRDSDRGDRGYRDGAGHLRTYGSSGAAHRDAPLPFHPSLAATALSSSSSRPPLSSRRRSSPPLPADRNSSDYRHHTQRNSISGFSDGSGDVVAGGGKGGPERSHTWSNLTRRRPSSSSSSSSSSDERERDRDRGGMGTRGGREIREMDRERGRVRETGRERDRKKAARLLRRCDVPGSRSPVTTGYDVDSCRLGKNCDRRGARLLGMKSQVVVGRQTNPSRSLAGLSVRSWGSAHGLLV